MVKSQKATNWVLFEMSKLEEQEFPENVKEYIKEVVDRGVHELTY